jgi:hypothetical protein
MGSEFNEQFDKCFRNKPDKPVMFGSIVSCARADHTLLPPGKFITMCVTSLRVLDDITDGRGVRLMYDFFSGACSVPCFMFSEHIRRRGVPMR